MTQIYMYLPQNQEGGIIEFFVRFFLLVACTQDMFNMLICQLNLHELYIWIKY